MYGYVWSYSTYITVCIGKLCLYIFLGPLKTLGAESIEKWEIKKTALK